ncbi:MAG: hypothetical protein HYR94_27730 [Chloroflexi bacterium]|nr:hypothetical protein [Chloroflexota bacterium]
MTQRHNNRLLLPLVARFLLGLAAASWTQRLHKMLDGSFVLLPDNKERR